MPTSRSSDRDSLGAKLGRGFVLLVSAATVLVLLATAGGFLGRWFWRLELLCHPRVQYFWCLALAAAVMLAARRWRMGAAAALGAIVNLALVAPVYWPARVPPTAGEALHLVSFNVLSSNARYADVLTYLRREDADVVLLLEVSPAWAEQLPALRDVYPHQHRSPRSNDFGIALLSKQPWSEVRTVESHDVEIPYIVAQFDRGGEKLTIIGAHPPPPLSAWMFRERNEQLSAVAQLARQAPGKTIVAGDLNITSFSPFFGDLLRDSGLRDSRQGFGVHTSWSPGLPLMGLTIDHCLVSPNIAVRSHEIGPDLGSDHRPVSVVLQ